MPAFVTFSIGLFLLYFPLYPLWLYWVGKKNSKSVLQDEGINEPYNKVSIILPMHNEARYIPQKMENLLNLHTRGKSLEILVALDGCTDNSKALLQAWRDDPRIVILEWPMRKGKAYAINQAVAASTGELLLFCDASQSIARNALGLLIGRLEEPGMVLVSGCLEKGASPSKWGSSLQNYINWLRKMESRAGWLVGAYGPLYLMKRKYFKPLDESVILDDLVLPVWVAEQGKGACFEGRAKVWDNRRFTYRIRFQRAYRMARGLVKASLWVFKARMPLRFKLMFICHKLLRILLPFSFLSCWILLLTLRWKLALTLLGVALVACLLDDRVRLLAIHNIATLCSLLLWPFFRKSPAWTCHN